MQEEPKTAEETKETATGTQPEKPTRKKRGPYKKRQKKEPLDNKPEPQEKLSTPLNLPCPTEMSIENHNKIMDKVNADYYELETKLKDKITKLKSQVEKQHQTGNKVKHNETQAIEIPLDKEMLVSILEDMLTDEIEGTLHLTKKA